jgi:sugar O-acyltransferase (sialic acid O-acetyltransferase NeuD family)
MTGPKSILVYGSTEFGAVVKELAVDCGYAFAGYIDDWNQGPDVLGSLASVQVSHGPDEYDVAMAIGYKHLQARRQLADQLRSIGYSLPTLIHPAAYVAKSAHVEPGSLVMARASIDVRAQIGPLTVVWPGAIVSHDCVVVGNSFLSPGATLCGFSRIGESSFLGAGSIVVDHVELLAGSFLRAGALYKGIRSASDPSTRS